MDNLREILDSWIEVWEARLDLVPYALVDDSVLGWSFMGQPISQMEENTHKEEIHQLLLMSIGQVVLSVSRMGYSFSLEKSKDSLVLRVFSDNSGDGSLIGIYKQNTFGLQAHSILFLSMAKLILKNHHPRKTNLV